MRFGELLRRISFLLHKTKCSEELQEEMRLHRELRARKLAAEGLPPREADSAASRRFGNQTLLREKANDMWGWNWLEDLAKDLRYTGRMMAANRGFSAIAILTLALGIGANTAIFSVMNSVLFRTLPVRDAQQLYRVTSDGMPQNATNTGDDRTSFSDYVFEHLRSDHQAVSDLMAYVPLGMNKVAVRAGGLPEEAAADMVSGNFFTGLGVGSVCGRVLSPGDESKHAAAAVLSYGYAVRRFGGSCSALGRVIDIKGVPFTVIGVAARRFTGVEPQPTDVWVPFQKRPELNAWGMQGDNFYASPNWWCI